MVDIEKLPRLACGLLDPGQTALRALR